MTLGLRSRLRLAELRIAPLPIPLSVPQPIGLRIPCLRLVLPRNPPRLSGFLLAPLLRVLVMTRLSRRPVSQRVSPPGGGGATRDTASARLADLIYEVCPASHPLFDAKAPCCEFEAWFGQPEASASRQRFRMYPRVAEVLEEVVARSESLARRSKPLSRVIPARAHAYAMADDAIFTSSQPVNSAFSQLVGPRTLGTRRWGSITFSEMERMGSNLLTQPSSTRHCLRYLPPCLVRLELLLPAPLLSGPSAGRACWPIPLSLFRSRRSVT